MSRNIVIEGWLTKSPPNRRLFRTRILVSMQRWRRRWFALRQSGELPGQYYLDYYADRSCRRLKGTINLDMCEQVDAGLHMERNNHAPFDPRIRGCVFTIQTQHRTYHLEADCEQEMEQWVDAICRVCGLRAAEEIKKEQMIDQSDSTARTTIRVEVKPEAGPSSESVEPQPGPSSRPDTYQNSISAVSAMNDHYECADGTGPYIPISECITGVRAQDEQRAFTFDTKNIVMSTRHDGQQLYTSQPHIRLANELSENESNLSDEEDGSLHASHQNIHWSVSKTFTKLTVSPKGNGSSEEGPPVPPRPPKTFAKNKEIIQKDQVIKIQETVEVPHGQQRLRVPRRMSQGAPVSPGRLQVPTLRYTDDEEETSPGHASMQYYNLPSLPPAVDRALKPRHSSHSVGHVNAIMFQAGLHSGYADEIRPDVLQYLDLDLHTSAPPQAKGPIEQRSTESGQGKSTSAEEESDSAYKTVDFLKTEAFNITRQDAEASRSFQY